MLALVVRQSPAAGDQVKFPSCSPRSRVRKLANPRPVNVLTASIDSEFDLLAPALKWRGIVSPELQRLPCSPTCARLQAIVQEGDSYTRACGGRAHAGESPCVCERRIDRSIGWSNQFWQPQLVGGWLAGVERYVQHT